MTLEELIEKLIEIEQNEGDRAEVYLDRMNDDKPPQSVRDVKTWRNTQGRLVVRLS